MRKSSLVVVVLAAFLFLAMSFTTQQAEVRYKNLKVLPKNIKKAELDTIMKTFAASLGMKCGGCHVRANDAQKSWDFASDSNEHKNIARGMMRMTARINKKYFKEVNNEKNIQIVTCFTCHNGKEHPGMKPPPQPQGPPGGPGGQPGARPGPQQGNQQGNTPGTQPTAPQGQTTPPAGAPVQPTSAPRPQNN
jgi:hypothetical protein